MRSTADHRAGTAAILAELEKQLDELAQRTVDCFFAELPDYAALSAAIVDDDVFPTTRDGLATLLWTVSREQPLPDAELRSVAAAAARRFQQNVTLESHLHAHRIWAREIWTSILAIADRAGPGGRAAAVTLAGRVIEQLHQFSTAATRGYLEEARSDRTRRERLNRDVIDALISGTGVERLPEAHARLYDLALSQNVVAVICRLYDVADDGALVRCEAEQEIESLLDRLVGVLQPFPRSCDKLIAVRENEVLLLHSVSSADDLAELVSRCGELTHADARVWVGVGGLYDGSHGTRTTYYEARAALDLSVDYGLERVAPFDSLLATHILRSSPYSDRLRQMTLEPVRAYDDSKNYDLVHTFWEYYTNRYNLTATAKRLHVHPNTVAYRLAKIRHLTGEDPDTPDGLLRLTLGLVILGGRQGRPAGARASSA